MRQVYMLHKSQYTTVVGGGFDSQTHHQRNFLLNETI